MRKILSGMLGLVMTFAVVGGVAYAAFSSQASVLGTTFASGTSALHVWNGSSYVESFTANWTFDHLFPGSTPAPTDFWLRNESDSAVTLAIQGKLRDGVTGDWDSFKDKVWVAITDFGVAPSDSDYHTLSQWNTGTATFAAASTGTSLGQGVEHHYGFYVKVDPSAGNEIQSKTLSGVAFDFTGTQTP